MVSDADRAVALLHVPMARRAAVAALWQLDETLAQVVRTTTQDMIGQMRLTWWHTHLSALDSGERLAEPVLSALAEDVLPHDVTGADLARLVEGWEALLEPPPLADDALMAFAAGRGAALFDLTARLCGGTAPGAGQGARWALTDLARHASAPLAGAARAAALGIMAERGGPRALRLLDRLAMIRLHRAADALAAPITRREGLRALFA